jgi:hypothetical protein
MQFYVMLGDELLARLYERTTASPFQYVKIEAHGLDPSSTRQKLLITDPMLSQRVFQACSRLLMRPGAWSLLCYTRATPDATRRLVSLARIGFFRLVLFDRDDTAESLRSVLLDEESESISRQVLRSIEPEILHLNEGLRRVVSDLFRRPRRYSLTPDLALAAGLSKPSLYRAFRRAGLCSPKHLVTAARVSRLAGAAILGHQSVLMAGKWAGYYDARALRSEVRLTLACGVQALRSQPEHDVVDRLANFATLQSATCQSVKRTTERRRCLA